MVVDVLAIAAHRDDVEQTCGGTLIRMAAQGYSTAILDLTQGEMGTRGTAREREREAEEAAEILGVVWRQALDIPDGRVENTFENRLKVARVLRQLRPRVLVLPYWQARHPDHSTASLLGYEASFLSGLVKLEVNQILSSPHPAVEPDSPPHRPFKIVYASLYHDVRPSFVVDISEHFETRLRALLAYRSQYSDQDAGSGIFTPRAQIRTRIESMARFYGALAGVEYAEPFVQKEVGLVEDLMKIPVASI
jgi:bacillithiol biosynthesis deacetylase BshB1